MPIPIIDYSKAPLLDSAAKNIFEDVLKGYQISQEPAKMREEQAKRIFENKLKDLEVQHKPKEYQLQDREKSLANKLKELAVMHKPREYELSDKQHSLANELQELAVMHKPKEYELSDREKSLANELKELEAKHKPKEYELKDALTEAQTKKANEPQGTKGALAAAFQVRDNLNPKDPNYERDLTAVNNYIRALGIKGMNNGVGMPGESIKINLPEGKEGYIEGLGKLKPGWQAVKDAKGNLIGVNVPMSDKQVQQWQAKEKFDIIYPFLNDSLSQYTGKDSWENYTRDAKNYGIDNAAKDRIDNFLAAKKLVAIGSTTENARIGGHATNVQLSQLRDTLDSSEVFKKIEQGRGFVLPPQYAKNSGEIFKKYLDLVEKAAKNNIPAYEFRALNPGNNNSHAMPGITVPVIPDNIQNKNDFQQWLQSLSPAEREAVKAQHLGSK